MESGALQRNLSDVKQDLQSAKRDPEISSAIFVSAVIATQIPDEIWQILTGIAARSIHR